MANGNNKFAWNQSSIDSLVHDAANKTSVLRPLLTLYGNQGGYTTNIFGHQIKGAGKAQCAPLSIPINQPLTPVILSCDFTLQQE
jgi:hypothetical protein